MSIESTRAIVTRYLNSQHGDLSALAEDVVFTVMGTGQESRGREGVAGMLKYLYSVAFDATAKSGLLLFGEKNAVLEGEFIGKHIGEFAGVPATGKQVRVPLCVVYDVEKDKITRARIYFEVPALMAQLGVTPPGR